MKLRPESEHLYNSPWSIAAKFSISMDFSQEQIAGMLQKYEADQHTGMDIQLAAENVYAYTSGYPVLVPPLFESITSDVFPKERETERAIF